MSNTKEKRFFAIFPDAIFPKNDFFGLQCFQQNLAIGLHVIYFFLSKNLEF